MGRRSLWGSIDPVRLGADITDRFHLGIQRALEVRERVGEERFFDVPFSEFVTDQVGMVGKICSHFDLEAADARRLEQWLQESRMDKRGAHKYSGDLYGLDAQAIYDRYAAYIERFSVRCRAA